MNHKIAAPVPEAITQLQRQLEQFRSTRPARTRLSESLWQAAVELARQHGMDAVAHSLRLDDTRLASQKAKSGYVFGQARRPAKVFRVGLYARISTNEQTLAMQNRAMREYAARRGWTIALPVREVNSGAVRREAREKVLEAARRREIDLVLVWRLDRWGRSVTDLLATLQELEHLGVGFVHDRSPGPDHAGRSSHGRPARHFR